MKKTFLSLLMSLVLMVAATAMASAAGDREYSKTDKSHAAMMDRGMDRPNFPKSQRISKLIGAEVQDRNGEELGKIDDLITGEDGRIDYLVIARGGVMGVGEEVVPVPVSNIDTSPTKEGKFVLDIQKKAFDKAPGFAKNDWPDIESSDWQTRARGYFGQHRGASPDMRQDINQDPNATPDMMNEDETNRQ